MNIQKKVKSIIFFAILLVIVLFATVIIQLVNIHKTKQTIAAQEQQIQQLEKTLDYYESKLPNKDHDSIQ